MQLRNDGGRGTPEGSRVVSVFLIVIGLVAMTTSMFMNWRFGWSLSDDLYDRSAMAVLHILVDPAAACLVIAGALMLRWGWKREGRGFLVIAVVLIAWSMLSVYGFMSSRIAMTVSHDKLVEFDKGQLGWMRGSSVNSDVAKGDRRLLRAESKELSQKIRQQLSFIPDAQAASIAAAFGVQVEKVQRALVMVSSGIAQVIKFVCLLAGGLIWPRKVSRNVSGHGDGEEGKRKEPDKPPAKAETSPGKQLPGVGKVYPLRAQMNAPLPIVNDNSFLPGLPAKVSSPDPAVDELLQRLVARTLKLESQQQGWRIAGVSKGQFSKLMARAEKQGKVTRSRHGNRKSVRIRMGDGGGRQALAVG